MILHVLKNIKDKKGRLILTFLLIMIAMVLVIYSLDVILNVKNNMDTTSINEIDKNKFSEYIRLLLLFIIIIIGFSATMINNTYSVILNGRVQEFKVLHQIGFSKRKIRRLISIEMLLIALTAIIIAVPLGATISRIYLNVNDFENYQVNLGPIIVFSLFSIPILLNIVRKNFNAIADKWDQNQFMPIRKRKRSKKRYKTEEEKEKSDKLGFITLVVALYILCIDFELIPPRFVISMDKTYLYLIFWLCMLSSMPFVIKMIVHTVKNLALLTSNNEFFIAAKQLQFYKHRTRKLFASVVIATVLVVGMLSTFYSVKTTSVDYVDSSINYEYMLIFDNPVMDSTLSINREDVYKGIIITAEVENQRDLTVYGIEENYFDMEQVKLNYENMDKSTLFQKNNLILMSKKRANDMGKDIHDFITLSINDNISEWSIGGYYEAIDTSKIFVSKDVLSSKVFGAKGITNVLYLNNVSYEEVEDIAQANKISGYKIISTDELKESYKTKLVNGTDMIEAFLYVNIIFTTSLIINMFLLAFQQRKKEFAITKVIGIDKKKIFLSVLLEGGIIFMTGTIVGTILGLVFTKGANLYFENTLFVKIYYHVPYADLFVAFGICLSILIVSLSVISYAIINNKNDVELSRS